MSSMVLCLRLLLLLQSQSRLLLLFVLLVWCAVYVADSRQVLLLRQLDGVLINCSINLMFSNGLPFPVLHIQWENTYSAFAWLLKMSIVCSFSMGLSFTNVNAQMFCAPYAKSVHEPSISFSSIMFGSKHANK